MSDLHCCLNEDADPGTGLYTSSRNFYDQSILMVFMTGIAPVEAFTFQFSGYPFADFTSVIAQCCAEPVG